jgi:AraC-like DNA-binding protein
MDRGARLNERATGTQGASLWHVDADWSLFAGPLGHNAPHAHSAAVYLAGLYGTFRLRIGTEAWRACRVAVIRAGTSYEFDAGGSPLGVLYLEPSAGRAEALAPLLTTCEEIAGALIGDGDVGPMRALFERRPATADCRDAAGDLLRFARVRTRRDIDPRVIRAIEVMQADGFRPTSIATTAAAAGLSSSRLQHLFTAEVGVPLRRYRRWQRLRSAIRVAAAGASLTEAAHAAGFADQAHFSRAFRSTFGAPPSRGL